MVFNPISVTVPHIAYLSLGGFVVLFGMFSLFLREKLYIGEACWAFIFGVIIGPYGADIFNPRAWGGGSEDTMNIIVLEFTRVVLAIGVFAIGVELPKAYMKRHWKSLFFLLVPVMTWGWFVSAGLIYAFIPGLSFLSSLAVAACLTPTDPILAAAVVGGKWADKHVPSHIRHLLAAESGCNDGAAFPFLYLALYFILESSPAHAMRDWFLLLWLYEVIFGTVIGALLGFGFRHLMMFCQRHDLIDRHSYVAQYVSLAMLTIGVCTIIGADDLLAAFACGTAFAWDGFFNRQTAESNFSSVIDLLFNVAAFVFVGAWMPFDKFNDAALTLSVWRLVVIAILVLLLRRLPIMVLLYRWIPDVKTFREAVFSGHFGPIGVGAVFISTYAVQVIHHDEHGENAHSEQAQLLAEVIQPIVAFMVLCSIVIHGLSIPSFSLGRRVHSVSRSVSRTWSRHAPPDWTNQARLVERGGENIVINRDSQMEEGKVPPDEKMASSKTSAITAVTSMEKSAIDEQSSGSKRDVSEADTRREAPPDGTEQVMEWHEGAHKVIERRKGPGDDVEVEIREEDDPQYVSRRSSAWSMRSITERGKRAVEQVATNVGDELKRIEEGVAQDTNDMPRNHDTPLSLDKPAEGQVDEDWASDESDATNDPSSSVKQRRGSVSSDGRKKPKILKIKTAGAIVASTRKGKLRNSLRRSYSQPQVPTEGVSEEEEEDRGRSGSPMTSAEPPHHLHSTTHHHHKRPSSSRSAIGGLAGGSTWHHKRPTSSGNAAHGGGVSSWHNGSHSKRPSSSGSAMGEGYPRNHQIERVWALSRTRESSPSRSVRFMDEDPYASRPGSASRSLAVSQVDLSEALETQRNNKVSFGVPDAASGSPRVMDGTGGGTPGDSSSSGNSPIASRSASWMNGNNTRS